MPKSPFHQAQFDVLETLGVMGDGVWDDEKFPVQGINPLGAASDPDVETNTGMLLFDSAGTEIIAGVAQLSHAYKEGSDVNPHLHWTKTTSAAGNVVWQLEYEVVNNGDVFTGTYPNVLTRDTPVAGTPDNNSAGECLITSFDLIDMTDKLISTLIFWKLSRLGGDAGDTYGADARLIEFDIHFQLDAAGSIQRFIKQSRPYDNR